jgi:hypothetical protein
VTTDPATTGRPHDPENRYRLYIDESGDHVFRKLDDAGHRYLCLLGCWFRGADYRTFHDSLAQFKQKHIPHSPDEPVILHREDIINRRRAFWRLRDSASEAAFDRDLLTLVAQANFKVAAVVIDKKVLQEKYPAPAHPYHLALGFLLQRFCGFLNHTNRNGDVMAESRGGREDRLLKDSYSRVYERGIWMTRAEFFQRALTSKELKLKPKSANIAGLQLADVLGHPVRQAVLREKHQTTAEPAPFAAKLLEIVDQKLNRHLYDSRVWGYGKVFFPE